MKKGSFILYLCIAIVGVLYIVSLFQNQKLKSLCERSHVHCSNINQILNMTNEAYLHSALSEDLVLKDKVETKNGVVYLPDTICDNQLFLYLTDTSCNPCIKRELKNVSQLSKKGYNVFLIGVFQTQREFLSLLSQYGIESHFITISQNTFIFEGNKQPVSNLEYFTINNNRIVSNTFLPVQRNDTLSVEYLKMLNLINE